MQFCLYQIFLKSTVYKIASEVKRPWYGLGKQFKKKKNVGNFATVAVQFTSQNSKIAKYGSDCTNFENIKKKVFYQYSTGGHFLFNNFCCKWKL